MMNSYTLQCTDRNRSLRVSPAKRMLPIAAIVCLCTMFIPSAFAADYYWVGGRAANTNWSTPGNWSSSSGGLADVITTPTTADNAIFDANSFPGTSLSQRTITVDVTAYCDSMIFRGAIPSDRLPILTINAAMYFKGSMLLYPGMTINGSGKILSFQSTRPNETIGYSIPTTTATITIPHNINISGTANWTIDTSFVNTISSGSFIFSSPGNLTINGYLDFNNTNATIDISGGGNVIINGYVKSPRFYFCAPSGTANSVSVGGNGNLTVNGNLTINYNGRFYLGGTGTKNISGNLALDNTSTNTFIEYGPVNVGGNLYVDGGGAFYIRNGCVFTVTGDVLHITATGGSFEIRNTGSKMSANSIMATSLAVSDYGAFDNVGNKNISLTNSFSCSSNGTFLGFQGITVTCGIYWINAGATIMNATTSAPALIRVGTGYFTANSGDTYNNVEFYDEGTHIVDRGTFNKITFLKGSGSLSTVAGILTDTLIINPQATYTFSNNTTTINKYLEIIPKPCGGMISVQSGKIALGASCNVIVSNLNIKNNTITGSAPSYTSLNSLDQGGNSGWTFSSSSTTQYWVGGNGNWNDGNHWANISGGTPGSGCIPTIFDNVVFDGNSGLNNTNTVSTNNVTAYCNNMTWTGITGSPTLNITNNSYLYIGGSLELNAGMKVTCARSTFYPPSNISSIPDMNDIATEVARIYGLHFVGNNSGNTIKTNGVTLSNGVCLCFVSGYIDPLAVGAGNGSWTLLDDLSMVGPIYFLRGNLNCNGKTVNTYSFFSKIADGTAGSNRTLNIANSTINVTHDWFYTGNTGVALTTTETNNSLIKNPVQSSRTNSIIAKSGDRYHNIEFQITGADNNNYKGTAINGIFNKITLSGVFTANQSFALDTIETDSLLLMADLGYTYTLNTTIKVNKYLASRQECGLMSKLSSISSSLAKTIIMGAGATVDMKNMLITRVNITGLPLVLVPDGKLGTGAETGWNINFIPYTQRYYWVGGTGEWNDVSHWAASSNGTGGVFCNPPTSENTVVFDEHSFSGDNQSVTVDYQSFCDSMLWKNIPHQNVALYISNINLTISGSVFLQQGMIVEGKVGSGNGKIIFNSDRANETLKTNEVRIGIANSSNKISIEFNTTGEMDIPDGLELRYNTITFGTSNISENARWNFGGTLLNRCETPGTIKFNFGILDLSQSGHANEIGGLASNTTHKTQELIIKNATLLVNTQNESATAWNFNGILTASNSENSTLNIMSTNNLMITSDYQVYDNVIFAKNGGRITATPGSNTTQFNKVIFLDTGRTMTATVENGIYKYLRFYSNGKINNITTDTLYFNFEAEYVYTFTSNAASTINKRWYGSGSICGKPRIQSSDVNGSPNQATINVKVEAANYPGDTLFLDMVRLNGIYFTVGSAYAKIKLGPVSPVDNFDTRYYNNPIPGDITNCSFMTYNEHFDRLGPDVTLCNNEYPYSISSKYYIITPESTYEWRKGTKTIYGGVLLNDYPQTDQTTSTWDVLSSMDTGVYYLAVHYHVNSSDKCILDADVKISNAPGGPTGDSPQEVCEGKTLSDLVVTGDNILWYDAAVGGNLLPNNTVLVNGTTYYASQTVASCQTVLAVTVIVKPKVPVSATIGIKK